MSSKSIRAKRQKAIQTLRDSGLSDAEIEEALGHSLAEEDNIIDVDIIGEEEARALNRGGIKTPSEAELLADLSTNGAIDQTQEGRNAVSLPACIETVQTAEAARTGLRWSEDWWARQTPETRDRRCVGTKNDGSQCQNPALRGATICRYHGANKKVVEKARQRLSLAADRMAEKLLGMAENAESESVRVRAVESALDRAGVIKPTQIEIGLMEPKPYEEIFEGLSTETREESRRRRGLHVSGEAEYSPAYGTARPDPDPDPADTYDPSDTYTPGEPESFSPPTERHMHYPATEPSSDGEVRPPHPADQGMRTRRYIDQDGEEYTPDEAIIRMARLANEDCGALPAQRELEGGHRRYTAHRRTIF